MKLLTEIRKAANNQASDALIEAHWLNSQQTSQTPALPSSPSTDSLLGIEELDDMKDFDYRTYLTDAFVVPTPDMHISEGHEKPGCFSKACPWCNPWFFNWLCDNGVANFMGPIPTECSISPPVTGVAENAASSSSMSHKFRRFVQKVVKTRGRTLEYQNQKNHEWITQSSDAVAVIKSKSSVEKAEGPLQTKYTKLPQSQKDVQTWTQKVCSCDPKDLEELPIDNNLFVTPSPDYPAQSDIPNYLIMRFDKAISLKTQQRLWYYWCKMRDELRTSDNNGHRDDKPAGHFGVWQHYAKLAYITSDTLKQTKYANIYVKAFLRILRDEVAQKLWNLLRRYDPETLERQIKLCNHLRKDPNFMENMRKMPHIDFGGIFFAAAVKEGGSQKVHLDWMDHPGTYAWVICVGPSWTGGELCFPQLGKKIPTRSGQVIAFRARYLAHFAGPSVGNRLVITGFTDRFIMNSALKAEKEKKTVEAPPLQGKKRKRGKKN